MRKYHIIIDKAFFFFFSIFIVRYQTSNWFFVWFTFHLLLHCMNFLHKKRFRGFFIYFYFCCFNWICNKHSLVMLNLSACSWVSFGDTSFSRFGIHKNKRKKLQYHSVQNIYIFTLACLYYQILFNNALTEDLDKAICANRCGLWLVVLRTDRPNPSRSINGIKIKSPNLYKTHREGYFDFFFFFDFLSQKFFFYLFFSFSFHDIIKLNIKGLKLLYSVYSKRCAFLTVNFTWLAFNWRFLYFYSLN